MITALSQSPPSHGQRRRRRLRACGWLAALSLALLLAGGMPQGAEEPMLLAAGDLRGEIKPCGCSPEGQMGGLPRRLTYLAAALEPGGAGPVLVDLGNNFPPPSPQGGLKVDLIQGLLGRFAPAAILPGPHELALGTDRLAGPLPYLVSNDTQGKAFLTHRTVMRAGSRIGIFGYLSPREVYQKSQQRFRLAPVNDALLDRLRSRSKKLGHDRVVLLFRGSDQELAAFVRSGIFHAIVAGNPHSDELNQVVERNVAGVRVPQVPTKGQGVLRLRLAAGGLAGQGAGQKTTVDWLTDKFEDHADARAPFKLYDERVKALFFASLATMEKRKAESPFAGAATCQACHAGPYTTWQASRHAGAVKTLEKVGKQFDPECLACHVVGLKKGGYLSKELTPQLAAVQCENCHGPGRAHGLNPKANRTGFDSRRADGRSAPVGEATCRGCHVGSHSPNFDFKTYWPKIFHRSQATHSAAKQN